MYLLLFLVSLFVILRSSVTYLSFRVFQHCEKVSLWQAEHRGIINRTDANVKAVQAVAFQKQWKLILTAAED